MHFKFILNTFLWVESIFSNGLLFQKNVIFMLTRSIDLYISLSVDTFIKILNDT